MNNIKRKLNNNNGVSILFALVLFLVATLVSLVIVIASTSSIKRESFFKNSIQKNIELDSAALLLKNVYSNSTCYYNYNKKSNTYILKSCSLGGLESTSNPYITILEEVSKKAIENSSTSYSSENNDAFSINDTIDSYSNTVTCKYNLYATNDNSNFVLSFKLDNGSLMYCKFNIKIEDDSTVTWSYYQSSLKGGQQ